MSEFLKQQFEKIVSLSEQEFNLIKSYFVERHFKKSDKVFIKNEYVYECYYVVSGLMKLVYVNDLGKEFIFSIVNEDRWESDFMAYFNKSKTTMYLECVEKTHLFCLSLENYYKLCNDFPQMQKFFHQKSTLGFTTTQQRLLYFLTTNINERFEIVSKNQPEIFKIVSKTLLASYLGVSRETLSRLSLKKSDVSHK